MIVQTSLSTDLGRLWPSPRSGHERFHANGQPVGPDLLSFWRWSASDLISNTMRGILAEFIVANALGIPTESARDAWGAYDLETLDGIKVEVKSSAYIQSWHQKRFSAITFGTRKTVIGMQIPTVLEIRRKDRPTYTSLPYSRTVTSAPLIP
jgi:hypothetical protein